MFEGGAWVVQSSFALAYPNPRPEQVAKVSAAARVACCTSEQPALLRGRSGSRRRVSVVCARARLPSRASACTRACTHVCVRARAFRDCGRRVLQSERIVRPHERSAAERQDDEL